MKIKRREKKVCKLKEKKNTTQEIKEKEKVYKKKEKRHFDA